jgi:pectate lyase
VKNVKNVILRNFAMTKVVGGDAIAIQVAQNVWVDHVDLSSDRDHDKDYYDGLLDVTHAADYVTISNTFFHDHWKCSLVGHSDSNGSEDKGHLTVTYNNNYWFNINSRGPSFRFGTGHLYNNYYENVSDGINTRQGAQLLVQNNVFVGSKKAVYSTNGGFAVVEGNDFGSSENTAPKGTLTKAAYDVQLLEAAAVKAAVVGTAGATLTF